MPHFLFALKVYNTVSAHVIIYANTFYKQIRGRAVNTNTTNTLSLCLSILGVIGIIALLSLAGIALWHYRGSRVGSFRWHLRNLHLKQLSALACFFFVAMAASYGILQEAWAIVYLIIAFQTGAWWLRFALSQRT